MLIYALEKEIGLTQTKARSLASCFVDIEDFLNVEADQIKNIKSISGKKMVKLTDDEIARILDFKSSGYLSSQLTVAENYLAVICRVFTKRQLDMIGRLTMKDLNPNPFLIRAINLDTPEEVVRLNVYMAATRSIVTSMGFFIENLLLSSSETINKASSGWDLIKTMDNGERAWLQIKSGTNTMNKDQIKSWTKEINNKIAEGDQAYLCFSYGKRNNDTVTLGLLKQLLPEWESRTLIGGELWNFVSDNSEYSSQLFEILRNSASQILNQRSISSEIEACAKRLTDEFIRKYGEGEQGISNYIESIF
ncbi:MAG: hypothetical protein F6K58_28415 [Symploca sp. SIO2E9]|nr:hypothetical protein [Symploca sp. SIO2E9]